MKAIPIISIKGGTGKTMVSVNLARELAEDHEVGLIDADLDSSNVLEVLDIAGERHNLVGERQFEPLRKDGMDIFSMSGILNSITDSVSKSGGEKAQIIQDAVLNTQWNVSKDSYFILDMNAGSGSTFKAVRKLFGDQILGAVVVTTPNTVVDAERSYDLCSKNKVRILGVVENMGKFICPNCDEVYHPFGEGKGKEFADRHSLNFFGTIPIMTDKEDEMFDGVLDNIVEEVTEHEG